MHLIKPCSGCNNGSLWSNPDLVIYEINVDFVNYNFWFENAMRMTASMGALSSI